MEVKNNPAGRLVDILSSARKAKDDERSRVVWGRLFNVDEKNTGELLRALADLIHLVHETRSALEKVPDIDHSLYLRPFKRIDAGLSNINLDATWAHWKNQFDESVINQLQYASDKLGRVSGFTTVQSQQLDDIRNDLDALTANVIDSDLPANLKALLIRNIEDLRRAVITYQIRGLDGIEQELARSFGSIALHKNDFKSAATDNAQESVIRKYFNVILKVDKLVSLAKNTKELASPILKMLFERSIDT